MGLSIENKKNSNSVKFGGFIIIFPEKTGGNPGPAGTSQLGPPTAEASVKKTERDTYEPLFVSVLFPKFPPPKISERWFSQTRS